MNGSASSAGVAAHPFSLRAALTAACAALTPDWGEAGLRQAEALLMETLRVPREQLYLETRHLDDTERDLLARRLRRLQSGEPLSYVLGTAGFYGLSLRVNPSVLIPRPDTEILVETVLAHEHRARRVFVDMGTGSGAIAAALLHERPEWSCVATELSRQALATARHNTPRGTCCLAQLDRLQAVRGPVDFIVSNPPYIPTAHIAGLDGSVRDFEPAAALDGGVDGLAFYRYLVAEAPRCLKPGAYLYLEIGYDQQAQTRALFTAAGWQAVTVRPDLASRPRVLLARRPP